MIFLIIYIVGVIIASFVIPKMLPYKEGMWRCEISGVRQISKDEHSLDNIARILIWPLFVAVAIILFPIAFISNLIEKLFEMLE
jgi:hypothetical protein